VFHSVRPSIPDIPASILERWAEATDGQATVNQSSPSPASAAEAETSKLSLSKDGYVVFDSLKSLPTSTWKEPVCKQQSATGGLVDNAHAVSHDCVPDCGGVLLQPALEHMADVLRSVLGLSLFGFDVVAVRTPSPSGCSSTPVSLFIIDVNYLPNFRVPGAATHVRHVIASAIRDCSQPVTV
jgi:hypothetical protein